MKRSLHWSWRPDHETVEGIKRGNRKFRRPEVPPNRINEVIEMAAKKVTTKATKTNGSAPATKGDGVALKTLCQQLKIDPRMARRKLRKADISGHDARDRWTFKPGSTALTKAREVLAA